MNAAPKRALRLTLVLDADTDQDMANALRNLAHKVERDEVSVGIWGGPSDGAIYELLRDSAMTHDAYHAAVRAYLQSKRP